MTQYFFTSMLESIGLTLAEGWYLPPSLYYLTSNIMQSFDKYDEPRLHMERLLKTRLIEFDLSTRILFPLEDAGIHTLGDLTKHSVDSLLRIPMLGKGRVAQISSFLSYHNLSLKAQ